MRLHLFCNVKFWHSKQKVFLSLDSSDRDSTISSSSEVTSHPEIQLELEDYPVQQSSDSSSNSAASSVLTNSNDERKGDDQIDDDDDEDLGDNFKWVSSDIPS